MTSFKRAISLSKQAPSTPFGLPCGLVLGLKLGLRVRVRVRFRVRVTFVDLPPALDDRVVCKG
jgi:hypothetical protein